VQIIRLEKRTGLDGKLIFQDTQRHLVPLYLFNWGWNIPVAEREASYSKP
jgi:hypothetical protein